MSDLELIERFLHDTFIAVSQRLDAVDGALRLLRNEIQQLHGKVAGNNEDTNVNPPRPP